MVVRFTKQGKKDFLFLRQSHPALYKKLTYLLNLIKIDPFTYPPEYEMLNGLKNVYSRRINIKHRLVYEVIKDLDTILVLACYSHYETL
jgi:Txe/YoeB family toxin of toxin-antitoxin system